MQQKMQQMQKELANTQVTGQSGAGLVSVIMTGRHDVKQVSIDSSLMLHLSFVPKKPELQFIVTIFLIGGKEIFYFVGFFSSSCCK